MTHRVRAFVLRTVCGCQYWSGWTGWIRKNYGLVWSQDLAGSEAMLSLAQEGQLRPWPCVGGKLLEGSLDGEGNYNWQAARRPRGCTTRRGAIHLGTIAAQESRWESKAEGAQNQLEVYASVERVLRAQAVGGKLHRAACTADGCSASTSTRMMGAAMEGTHHGTESRSYRQGFASPLGTRTVKLVCTVAGNRARRRLESKMS